MKKLTTQDFIVRARLKHGDRYGYERVKYIDYNSKVEIVCTKHGSFWQDASSHWRGKGCLKCSRLADKSNTDEFIRRAMSMHGDRFIYDKVKYVECHEKVIIVCRKHGDFSQIAKDHLRGDGCRKCGLEVMQEARKGNTEEFLSRAKLVHGDRYDYTKSIYNDTNGSLSNVIIICKKHGEFLQTPHSHISGHGCPNCLTVNRQNMWLDYIGLPNDVDHRNRSIRIDGRLLKPDGYKGAGKPSPIYGLG